MPMYEYKCEHCNHQFEVLQSFREALLNDCPICENKSLKRLISGGVGIIFKGTGFYETDYKRKSDHLNPKGDK